MRGILHALAIMLVIMCLAIILAVMFLTGRAHAYTGLSWTMPTTNAASGVNGCDSIGAPIPAAEYSRWWVYRTAPAAPFVAVDSLAFGTAQTGAAIVRTWN